MCDNGHLLSPSTNPFTEHPNPHISKSVFVLTAPYRQAEAEDCQHNPFHHTVSQEHPTVFHTVTQKDTKNSDEHTPSHWTNFNKIQQIEWNLPLYSRRAFPTAVMETVSTGNDVGVFAGKRDGKFNQLWFCRKAEKS